MCVSEITKDSSGSISTSGAENFSDDDGESVVSSTSGISSKHSPVTPDRQFYDVDPSGRNKRHQLPQQPPQSSSNLSRSPGANARDMDSRDVYRERDFHQRHPPGGAPASGTQQRRELERGGSLEKAPPTGSMTKHGAERPGSGQLVERPRNSTRPAQVKRGKRRDYFDDRDRFDHTVAPPGGPRSPQYESGNEDFQELVDNNQISPRKILDDIPDSDLIDYEDDGEGESLVDDVDMEFDDSHVRVFIALFDYDPVTMSPNPDAIDEELPFKEGQLIKVIQTDLHYVLL